MSDKMFNFNPADYAAQFAKEGYVHIKQGVTPEFYAKMSKQVEESIQHKKMAQFAIGDKQQAMYELPEGGDYVSEIRNTVGGVCTLDPRKVVLSERHVKAYDKDAAAEP